MAKDQLDKGYGNANFYFSTRAVLDQAYLCRIWLRPYLSPFADQSGNLAGDGASCPTATQGLAIKSAQSSQHQALEAVSIAVNCELPPSR